jgi:hypothetical protein
MLRQVAAGPTLGLGIAGLALLLVTAIPQRWNAPLAMAIAAAAGLLGAAQ